MLAYNSNLYYKIIWRISMDQSVKHNFFVWSIFSSICIVILGSGWHFLYDILGKSNPVAWCAPINESIWEHLKLTLYPILIVMLILYSLHFIPCEPSIHKVILMVSASVCISDLIIISIYYVFSGGFGLTGMAIDLTAYGIGILAGQLLSAIHLLPLRQVPKWVYGIGYVVLIGLIIVTAVFSYNAPDLPIFIPPTE